MERIELSGFRPTNSPSGLITPTNSNARRNQQDKLSLDQYGTIFGSVKDALSSHSSEPETFRNESAFELYLVSETLLEQPSVFHYNPHDHTLEILWGISRATMFGNLLTADIAPQDIIILTCVWDRLVPRYGDFAYSKAMYAAGRLSHTLSLAASVINVSYDSIDTYDDDQVARILDINIEHEQSLCMLVLS